MKRLRDLVIFWLGLSVTVAGMAYGLTGTSPSVDVPITITGSGDALPYMIGYITKDDPGNATTIANWLGRPLDIIGSTANFAFTETNYPSQFRLAYAVPMTDMFAIGACGGADMAAAASGAYDTCYQGMANAMAASGLTVHAVRFGWELNGDWYPWGANGADGFGDGSPGTNVTAANYIATFRRMHDIFKAAMPNVNIDWNVAWAFGDNAYGTGNPPDRYPGDAYVDIVSMDVYEGQFVPTWDDMLGGPGSYGLAWLASFAQSHNKKVGLPEWGAETDDGSMMDSIITWMNGLGASFSFQTYTQYPPALQMVNFGSAPNMQAVWIARWGNTHYQPVCTGELAFVSRSNGGFDNIYTMEPDCVNIVRLTNNSFSDMNPAWSFNGEKIAFWRINGSDLAVFLMNPDGSTPTRISPTASLDVFPSWTPAGRIIFSHLTMPPPPGTTPAPSEIMIMDSTGANRSVLLAAGGFYHIGAKMNAAGTKIVFQTDMFGGQHVAVMNADGTNVQQLTTLGANGDPAWSPDGTEISFGSNREGGGNLNIYKMSADGTNQVKLTNFVLPFEAGDTGWSPDGTLIAFEVDNGGMGQSDPNAPAEVWIMGSDGSNPHTTGVACSGVGCSPRWRPQ